MKLEEIRRRGIEHRVADRRRRLRRSLLPAVAMCVLTGVLFALTLPDPEKWARGEWLQPGGLMYERFGPAGAVFVVRAAIGLVLVASLAVVGVTLLQLRESALRRKVTDAYRIFDPPDRR